MSDLYSDLIRKINLQRSVHAHYEHKAKLISVIFKSFSIIVPAIITFVAFSDLTFLSIFIKSLTTDHVKLFIGIGSFFVFLNAVFDDIFNITGKCNSYRNAIEQYSQLLRDIKSYKSQSHSDNSDEKLELYNQRYIQISSNTICFTDKEFNKAEVEILKRNAIRQVLKKEPFLMFWEIKPKAKRMANQ